MWLVEIDHLAALEPHLKFNEPIGGTMEVKQKMVELHPKARRVFKVGLACWLFAVPWMATADEVFIPASTPAAPLGGARVTGKVTQNTGTAVQLELRDGRSITVDFNAAQQHHLLGRIVVGEFLVVQGSLSGGVMTAVAASRAKSNPNAWMPDIP